MKRCVCCFGEYEDVFEVCPRCGSSMGCPAADGAHLTPGTLLKQRYFIGIAAGTGGFGILYRALDTILNKAVAVKEFFPAGLVARNGDGRTVAVCNSCCEAAFTYRKKQFIKEARTLSRFAGERCVPQTLDYFEENGTAYLVMEFLQGKNLAKPGENLLIGTDFAVFATAEAARAAALLHRQNTVHRDIAPDNLFVCTEGDASRVVLLDFGAAVPEGQCPKAEDRVWKAGYSAPELCGEGAVEKTADVYSLGCTLYALLTGTCPPGADERSPGKKDLPKVGGKQLPNALWKVICKATDLIPRKRYADAEDFLLALSKASAAAGVSLRALQKAEVPEVRKPKTEIKVADMTETRGVTETLPSRLLPGTELQGRYTVGLGFSRCGVLNRYKGTDRVLRCPVEICEFFPRGLCERWFDGVRVQGVGPDGAFGDCLTVFQRNLERYTANGNTVCEMFSEIFAENGTLYAVCQDTAAVPLGETLRYLKGKKNSEKEVKALLQPVAKTLLTLAAGQYAHGNLTPKTICTDGKNVCLKNAAILCVPSGTEKRLHRLPEPGFWTPPEWGAEWGTSTLPGDCYALGAIAWRLLTGKEPMRAAERMALRVSTGRDPQPALRDLVRVEKALAGAVDAALSLQPEGREKILEVLRQ